MGVRRQAGAADLAAEVVEIVLRQAPLEERPGVDAGGGVALESPGWPSSLPRKKWLNPTSYRLADEA